MSQRPLQLRYRLATTAVSCTATVTTTTVDGADPVERRDVAAAVVVRADTTGMATLDLDRSGLADHSVMLSLTPDGRLAGASQTSTGVGTAVVAAAASIAGEAAGALTKLKAVAGLPSRHDAVVDAQGRAVDALVATVAKLGDGTSASAELSDIDKALTLLAAQRARLEAEAAAALAARTTVTTEHHSAVLDAGQLPTEAQLWAGPDAMRAAGRAAAAEVWQRLGVCATLADPPAPEPADREGDAPFQAGAEHRLWYRRPRRSTLSVWRRSDGAPQLVSRADIDVLDAHCEHTGLPLGSGGLFGHEAMTATMAADGTLASLGDTTTSAVGNVAGALEGFATGVGTGAKVGAGLVTSLTPTSPDAQALIDLTATRDRLKLEQEIAGLRAGGTVSP